MPYEMRVRCPPRLRANTTSPASGRCSAQVAGGDRCGVDLEHDEIAVLVGAGDGALLGAAVGERDERGAVAQVVGVGQHLAGSDDDAAATTVLADGHERAAELARERCGRWRRGCR